MVIYTYPRARLAAFPAAVKSLWSRGWID